MDVHWFRKLRERQEVKALAKARSEGVAEARHRDEVLCRVEYILAQLAIAEWSSDPVLLQRVCSDSVAVLKQLGEMNRTGIAGGGRLVDHVEKMREVN